MIAHHLPLAIGYRGDVDLVEGGWDGNTLPPTIFIDGGKAARGKEDKDT